MPRYSHSKISTFEQCPHKYKLKYIDKVEGVLGDSIESFLGKRVHETLAKLYEDLKFMKENTLKELLDHLDEIWEKNWNDSIIIVKKEYKKEHYKALAKRMVTDYYKKYKPFNQSTTLATEKKIEITLDKEGKYKIIGYVDRLACTGEDYEIHDYKTNANLPQAKYMEEDRQLALYAISVKHDYKDAKKVKLVWHFLSPDKEVVMERTEEQLEMLKKDIVKSIDKIEAEEDYKTEKSALCNWCEFMPICPLYAHKYKTDSMKVNEFLKEPGVDLVNKYAELTQKKKELIEEIETEMMMVKEALVKYAEKEKVEYVYGSDVKALIRAFEEIKFPGKSDKERKELDEIIKKLGKWAEVSELDTTALKKIVKEKKWPKELLEKINRFKHIERAERIYLSRVDREKEDDEGED